MEALIEELRLIKSPELTPIETILIDNIYHCINKQSKLLKQMMEYIREDKLKELIKTAEELKYLTAWDNTLDKMKDQFFEYAEKDTLNKIINELAFKAESQWGQPFLIPKLVLKTFRYSAEVKQSNPKADIAKKLGAKIVI